jgi:hypothetical protein
MCRICVVTNYECSKTWDINQIDRENLSLISARTILWETNSKETKYKRAKKICFSKTKIVWFYVNEGNNIEGLHF